MTPELAALAALHARCFETPRPWSAEEIAATLAAPGAFLLTEDAGFLIGRAIAGEAELLTLAVDPGRRRAGTGRRLLARFLEETRARGAGTAFLEVASDNAGAIALYLEGGFEPAGRRRGYYARPGAAPLDAVVMRQADRKAP